MDVAADVDMLSIRDGHVNNCFFTLEDFQDLQDSIRLGALLFAEATSPAAESAAHIWHEAASQPWHCRYDQIIITCRTRDLATRNK